MEFGESLFFPTEMTLRDVRRTYNRYRKIYFADYEMPKAEDVIFRFKSKKSLGSDYGRTHRNEIPEAPGVYVWEIHLSNDLKLYPDFLYLVLMHEMVHVARWRLNHGPGWKEEALRLGQLGALGEFL